MNGAADVSKVLGGRSSGGGSYLCPCPVSTHGKGKGDRNPSLSVCDGDTALLVTCFAGCDPLDVLDELRRRELLDDDSPTFRLKQARPKPKRTPDQDHAQRQLEKAKFLWGKRQPAEDSPVDFYLRGPRKYGGPIPPTLGFLPPLKPGHHPAMISAFGIPDEPEPGTLSISNEQVRGIHLTLLKPDGGGKADTKPDKIMVGSSNGWPIVLAPMNDFLGLIICEGIETGLSLHEATGCGIWAAGSASRMPGLADKVQDYCDCVTIAAEADGGQKFANDLAKRLSARGLYCELKII